MKCSQSASDPADATRVSSPRRSPAPAAIVVGVATLLLGSATLAAEPPAAESARVLSDAAAPEAAAGPMTQSTEARASSSAPQTDRERGQDAKEHKRIAKERRANATSETESMAALAGAESEFVEQKCAVTKSTGTHVRRMACVSPAQQEANDKYAEQQAKDYLRHASEQKALAAARQYQHMTADPF